MPVLRAEYLTNKLRPKTITWINYTLAYHAEEMPSFKGDPDVKE
jgi:hypothetical protein